MEGGKATLSAGKVRVGVATALVSEYPASPPLSTDEPIHTSEGVFSRMVESVYYAVSTDEARPAFTGALLESLPGALLLVATDGHRLVKTEMAHTRGLGRSVIVPRDALAEVKRCFPTSHVNIRVAGGNVEFSDGVTTVTARTVPGRFPDYTQVFPTAEGHRVTVERKRAVSAVKRAITYAGKTGIITVTALDGELTLTTRDPRDPESGELAEAVACVGMGYHEPIRAASGYLLDALTHLDGDGVSVAFHSTEDPIVLRGSDDPDTLAIVMPMQL